MTRSAGRAPKERVGDVLAEAGFTTEGPPVRLQGSGIVVHDVATDATGGRWVIELGGPFVRFRGGLTSVDAVWRTLGRAHALRGLGERVLVLTSELPRRRTELDQALRAAGPAAMFDVIDVFDPDALERLAAYGAGQVDTDPRVLEPGRTGCERPHDRRSRSGAAGEVDRLVDLARSAAGGGPRRRRRRDRWRRRGRRTSSCAPRSHRSPRRPPSPGHPSRPT